MPSILVGTDLHRFGTAFSVQVDICRPMVTPVRKA